MLGIFSLVGWPDSLEKVQEMEEGMTHEVHCPECHDYMSRVKVSEKPNTVFQLTCAMCGSGWELTIERVTNRERIVKVTMDRTKDPDSD